MKVGIIQSNYIPWRGYFDFISDVELFIFHDNIQYTKQDWRNRNKIKSVKGLEWLTVPVNYKKTGQLIEHTLIGYERIGRKGTWQDEHIKKFEVAYRQAPYVDHALQILREAFDARDETISALNVRLIKLICSYLDIPTKMAMSRDFQATGTKTERLIQLLTEANATCYLSGPAAKAYLDKDLFDQHGISLEYKSYDYPSYPQLHGEFEGGVTVLDLIANCGSEARAYITSRTANVVA
ncbi:MAG: WbqC family protein [Desulfovibrionales bacterium]|nr:WbqC family protein [Desulfovibrionales bacterium]